MKSKNIPSDIKVKSIKDAQNEIKDIIANLEDTQTNLEESIDKYTRIVQLNTHIQHLYGNQKMALNYNLKYCMLLCTKNLCLIKMQKVIVGLWV